MSLCEDFLRPDRWRALGPRREGARRARGESAPSLWLPGQDTASAPHTQ